MNENQGDRRRREGGKGMERERTFREPSAEEVKSFPLATIESRTGPR